MDYIITAKRDAHSYDNCEDGAIVDPLERRKAAIFNRQASMRVVTDALLQDLQQLIDTGADLKIIHEAPIFGMVIVQCDEDVAEKIKGLPSVKRIQKDAEIPVKLLNNKL